MADNKKISEQIRTILREKYLSDGGYLTLSEIFAVLGKNKSSAQTHVAQLCQTGEIKRLRNGVFQWAGKTNNRPKTEIIWALFQARRQMTISDIVELSGAPRQYVYVWMCVLARDGHVRRISRGKYQVISITPHVPTDKIAERKRRKKTGTICTAETLAMAYSDVIKRTPLNPPLTGGKKRKGDKG